MHNLYYKTYNNMITEKIDPINQLMINLFIDCIDDVKDRQAFMQHYRNALNEIRLAINEAFEYGKQNPNEDIYNYFGTKYIALKKTKALTNFHLFLALDKYKNYDYKGFNAAYEEYLKELENEQKSHII